jgi:large subunit ribosomal protein L22
MEYKATLRYLHITPRKVSRLVDGVRGKNAYAARAILAALPQKSSRALVKLIDAAAASARLKDGVAVEALRIKRFEVNPGPKRKRFMPRAFGRVSPVEKRMSHVTLALEGREDTGDARAPGDAAMRALSRAAKKPRSWSRSESAADTRKRHSTIRETGKRIFRRKTI